MESLSAAPAWRASGNVKEEGSLGALGNNKRDYLRTAKLRRLLALLAKAAPTVSLALVLSGCLGVRTYSVDKTVLSPDVREATLDELLAKMGAEYAAVQTLNLRVEITATEGGAHQGQVKQLPSFAGIILLRKPEDLRVLMQVPVVRSVALDMVSDGKNFKLFIPPKNKAIVGPEVMTQPSTNGLYNLRPSIIRDALQIPPVEPDDFVTLTSNSRILAPARGKKEAIEEPDYDISVLRAKPGQTHVLERVRVIHISRVTLLPYEQDLYDHEGRIVTSISYSKFQKFGAVDYPMSIYLQRPLDEYTLRIDINKLTLNQSMDDEQFKLTIPEGVPVQKM
jgi:outer membrane lipoprotein-sorting protein